MAKPKADAPRQPGTALFDVPAVEKETPLMRQYNQIKQQYPYTLLLFRIGDFYETFGEDAITAANILGIVLTKRANGSASHIELAGFPHHSLNVYLPKLVRAGQRVAICDQLEDPKLAKGIVKRGVTEIVTPGITLSDQLLDHQRNNYLAATVFQNSDWLGAAFVDVSTGDFFCLAGTGAQVEKMLFSLCPAEVLVPRKDQQAFRTRFGEDFNVFRLEDWVFEEAYGTETLLRHFGTTSLKGYGLEDAPLGAAAAGALLHYLNQNEQRDLPHINRIYLFQDQQHLALDRFTIRNLELLQPVFADGKAFVDALDHTCTSMGARLLRRWVTFPLLEEGAINTRLDCVQALLETPALLEAVEQSLAGISDLERLLARLATRRLSPREALSLRQTLERLGPLRTRLAQADADAFAPLAQQTPPADAPLGLLAHRLHNDAGPVLAKGYAIRAGVSPELDDLRALKANTEAVLEKMRQREAMRTGITSLKIAYNKVFGFYIEITHANRDRVPPDYIRKQTLTTAERYITPELKDFEEKILTAEERILALETQLYNQLLDDLVPHIPALQQAAQLIASLDCLLAFARAAQRMNYTRPTLLPGGLLRIVAGRHPVIEQILPPDSPYVPNSIELDPCSRQIILVTGPNMAGKSALLRQTALIQLMAQMGSFVPAQRAEMGIVDRIFTRVGAADNVSAGESTFMVEMNEAARILNTATGRSLVLLDEIGRGTSTYDGVSIAWAIVEYLHEVVGCKTLFATHYHELAELADRLPRAHNCNVGVREVGGKVIFLRTLQPGHSAHSFGINVAQMAGLPPQVVARARALLAHFEGHRQGLRAPAGTASTAPTGVHVRDAVAHRVAELLAAADIDRLTPVEALLKLHELKALLNT